MASKQDKPNPKSEMKRRVKRTARGNVNSMLKKIVHEHPEVILDLDRGQIRRSLTS